MGAKPLVRVTASTAEEVCARFNVKKEAFALLRHGMAPADFVEALIANKQYVNGIDFMAHALPAREAVWWGCLCLQHACGDNFSPTDRAACRAAVQWVMQPTEVNRTATLAPAQAAGPASPAAGLAMAVYQTGGNIAPPKAPPMAPPPFASAKAVAGAVKMACTKADPAKIVETQRQYLDLAIRMAEGNSR
ncbi:MAG: hypothetical protein LAP13_09920 [Acidobacteriia bacterium]|nr:hypothetical protein [Terriglobia bacterium]